MATSGKSTPRKSTPAGRKARTSPTRKSTGAADAPSEARAKLRAVETVPEPAEATAAEAEGTQDGRFKRPDLIEAVSARSALKRSDLRVVVELVLDELGKAIDANEELVLPPLGKVMVKKRKPDEDGPDILTVKIRRPDAGSDAQGTSPLADPDEDG